MSSGKVVELTTEEGSEWLMSALSTVNRDRVIPPKAAGSACSIMGTDDVTYRAALHAAATSRYTH